MPDAPERFDAVVVGSGFGGAVTACRLAEAGQDVLVLERGRPYPPGAFPRTPHGFKANFWAPDEGLYGLFDIRSFDHLDVVLASGLGGGSLIYANVMLRKDERTFVREDVLDGGYEDWPVTRADLDPHYDRVEDRLRPVRYPLDHAPFAATPKTHAMLEAAGRLGLEAELPRLAVRFAADGEDPAPGRPLAERRPNVHHAARTTCTLVGECDVGCNAGAKDSLDFTYLSDAQHAGATLRTCCEARVLARRPDGDWTVTYLQHRPARAGHRDDLLDPAAAADRRTVRAGRVVLAAGAVGSPHLLLANRAGLPGLSSQLGHRVSANGDAIAWIRDTTRLREDGVRVPRYLDPSHGPVITASITVPAERSASGRAFHVQDAGAPAFTEWWWHGLDVPGDVWHARRRLLMRVVDRLRGRRHSRVSGLLSALLGTASGSAAMMPVLAMGRDFPDGRYRLDGSELQLDWRATRSRDYYRGVRSSFDQVARALGGRTLADPRHQLTTGLTVHPVGGCPMGSDARRGVVDPWGRVFGHPGLHVADGSILPGPVGPNPSLTIAAFADRVADAILDARPSPAT